MFHLHCAMDLFFARFANLASFGDENSHSSANDASDSFVQIDPFGHSQENAENSCNRSLKLLIFTKLNVAPLELTRQMMLAKILDQ